MIEYNSQEMGKIKNSFPNLYYESESHSIKGELDITAFYKNHHDKWVIMQCSPSDDKCIVDSYDIKICLNENPPKVFELEERIKRLYYEDKHLFTDDSCCLGLFLENPNETLSDFVIKKVYPYFVWHAYFEKYGEKPPCGEYSHARGYEEFFEEHKNISSENISSKSPPSKNISTLHAEWLAAQPLSEENRNALWEWIRMRCNYCSNHIEGNPLTYDETNTLLKKQKTSGHESRQYKEMKAHDTAFGHIIVLAEPSAYPITEADIRDINKSCLKEPFYKTAQTPDGKPTSKKIIPGEYKKQPNHVLITKTGGTFHFATPEETPAKMRELTVWLQERLSKTTAEQVQTIAPFLAELHQRFILIHPFDDGNGRTVRLLINYVLIRLDFLPIDIKYSPRYINAVECSDTGDISHLENLFADNITAMLEKGISAKDERININEK